LSEHGVLRSERGVDFLNKTVKNAEAEEVAESKFVGDFSAISAPSAFQFLRRLMGLADLSLRVGLEVHGW
jgi:hypothetical protein